MSKRNQKLQPIPCLMLSKTGSLRLSKECNAQAIGGRCDFSGCHMWISSLEAMSHQDLLPTPVPGEPSWEEAERNKHIPCSQVLHLFLQVRSIRIYKSILLNGFHTSQGQCAIAISVGVIRDRTLLLCKTEMLSNTPAMCLLFLA